MSAKYRTLLPVPYSDGREQAESQPSQQCQSDKSTMQVTSACQYCRQKKRKCSGERPLCEQCRVEARECVYEFLPGQKRSETLRLKNERLQNTVNTMMELYWYLQTQEKDDVAQALVAIQSGADPSQVMEALNSGASSHDGLNSVVTQNDLLTTNDSDTALDGDQSFLQGELSESGRGTETELSNEISPTDQSPITQSMLQPSEVIAALDSGVEAFFTCTGCIFHIYDQNEAHRLLSVIRPKIRDAGINWPQLFFRDSTPIQLKASFCSVCIMAAVGLQYTKNPIPAIHFEPSAENGMYHYITIFYEFTKHLMEAVIENDTPEAMKVCAALCVFNTIGHATVALAYADMGINFALNLGPSAKYCPASLSEAAWVNYKRVVRTLVSLRSWLISTLGYMPTDDAGLRSGFRWIIDQKDPTPDEIIQQELDKVVQIEANLLRTIDSFRDISPALFSSTRGDLEQWYEQLPQWMHLSALVEADELTTGRRRTVFLVHLFYLSAQILTARLAHGGRHSPLLRYDVEDVRIAASDGVLAARTASRVLQLQLDEQAIFQRCWLCEFTAYMSCLVLLHSAVQMLLYGCSQSVWQRELSYAKSCLDVLEHCGNVDKVALRFAETTRSYYNLLTAQVQQDIGLPVVDMPEKFDYLFLAPRLPSSHLDQASQDLHKLVSCPFGRPSNLHAEATLKAGFGTHLNWTSSTTLPLKDGTTEAARSRSVIEMMLPGMRSGQFLGSSQPHGWDSLLNLDEL